MIDPEDLKRSSFLKELTALSRRHNIRIGGCPYLLEVPKEEQGKYTLGDNIDLLKWEGERPRN